MVVQLLRFFTPLLALLGRKRIVGGELICIEVGQGEFEGLASGFLGEGGIFQVSPAAVERRSVKGLVGTDEGEGFPLRLCSECTS